MKHPNRKIPFVRPTILFPSLVLLVCFATLAAGCGLGVSKEDTLRSVSKPISQSVVHDVTVTSDGNFVPSTLRIRSGDTVRWILSNRSDSIIPARACSVGSGFVPEAYSPTNPVGFNGAPIVRKAGGVFALAPSKKGFVEVNGSCNKSFATVGSTSLCRTGNLNETMDSTLASSSITGVYIRLDWGKVQTGYSASTDTYTYDWTTVIREISRAVRNGKLFSISFRAGKLGTPDWIFSTNPDGTPRTNHGGVTRLSFQDGASDIPDDQCGDPMDLGNPTTPLDHNQNLIINRDAQGNIIYTPYQKHFFALLTEVAKLIKSRSDWYRALAYVKPGGANVHSHENKLPNSCKTGCLCNTQVWANAGYTPKGLYHFYKLQWKLLSTLFPQKDIAYSLIQAGFPRVSNTGEYLLADGSSSGGGTVPTAFQQTNKILNQGQSLIGDIFTVSHLGIGVIPPSGTCLNEGLHPAIGPYSDPGSGCPNRWVLREGSEGQNTGFQTNNSKKVDTPEKLDETFQNLWVNSDGVFLEIYEERLWEGERMYLGGILSPNSANPRSISDWDRLLHTRRAGLYPNLHDRNSLTFTHTFHLGQSSRPETVTYIHGFKHLTKTQCGAGSVIGNTITILP